MTTTLSGTHATVTIELTKVTSQFGRVYPAFVVTGPTGYRAELPACQRDECADGKLTVCRKANGHIETVDAWLKHCQTYCHGWHDESVERFALEVLATYGTGVRAGALNLKYGNQHHISRTVGVPRGRVAHWSFHTIPGWPDPEARAW